MKLKIRKAAGSWYVILPPLYFGSEKPWPEPCGSFDEAVGYARSILKDIS